MSGMNTTVVFLIFNRPECSARTFAEIRRTRPGRLLVVADGPRENREGEAEACAETRRIVDDGVDWPCDVLRNYATTNLGCAQRVSSGLTWAFSVVEEAIVLEDDCLPDPSFFWYCDELLEKYRDDARIGQICGTPFVTQKLDRSTSYVFSRYGPIWGWATWRRAWRHYDLHLSNWPELRESGGLAGAVHSNVELKWRANLYDAIHHGPPTTWDFQWGYAKITQSMLSAVPTRNLIENIGCGAGATHTTDARTTFERGSMPSPLIHPPCVLPDPQFDELFSAHCRSTIVSRLRGRIGRLRRRLRSAASGNDRNPSP